MVSSRGATVRVNAPHNGEVKQEALAEPLSSVMRLILGRSIAIAGADRR